MSHLRSEFRLPPGVILCGVGILFIGIAFSRLRRVSSSSLSATKNSDSTVTETGAQCNRSVVPIKVVVANLPSGWSVAPLIFDSPGVAIIPLLEPCTTEGDVNYEAHGCFILCEGPLDILTLEPETDSSDLFSRYIRGRRFFDALTTCDVSLTRIEETVFQCTHGCFTHVAIAHEEHLAVLFGRNGPYMISLVITNYLQVTEEDTNGSCFPKVTQNEVQTIIDACELVPLIDDVRLPDTPTGLLEGRLRVTCVHKGFDIIITTTSGVRIETAEENGPILRIKSDVSPIKKITLDSTLLDKIVDGASLESLLESCGVEKSFSMILSLQVEKKADNLMSQIASDTVSAVFSHTSLGVYFSVNPRNSVLREPMMTNDLCVLYYPSGDKEMDEQVDITPPQASIRLVKELPQTWKTDFSTDEELKHSVLFHFTDWAHEQVPSNVTEISGYRCVQLNEGKEGLSCRSYIIPLKHAVFVIRWEAKSTDWEKHLPLLHDFLDTLHLADPTV